MSIRQVKCDAAYIFTVVKEKEKTKRLWAREWILRRCDLGVHETLLYELRIEDPQQLDIFLRMSDRV